MTEITLVRDTYKSDATFGILKVDDFSCQTLEPPKDNEYPNRRCIPTGKYGLYLRYSPHHGYAVLGYSGIPGFTDVEIHPGNDVYDTLACTIVGDTRSTIIRQGITLDAVINSRATYGRLMTKLGWPDYAQLNTWDQVRQATLTRPSEWEITVSG